MQVRPGTMLAWLLLGLALLFLYAPLVPPAIHSFEGVSHGGAGLFATMRQSSRISGWCERCAPR